MPYTETVEAQSQRGVGLFEGARGWFGVTITQIGVEICS
jgi:hypothetical protein